MTKYPINHHAFTTKIIEILKTHFSDDALDILETSPLLGYLNTKTKSASSGSKARGAFANHYALYVVIEDYIAKGFLENSDDYSKYEGARFTDLFQRQRELPFGAKLQNHALNARLNDEFKKFYPTLDKQPIYDVERFGIHFVVSPRHADILLVTGVVSRAMQTAKNVEATPNPKWVIEMGDCASCGGEFGISYASCGAVSNVIPVDVTISGCPPTPLILLKALLSLITQK